MNFKKPLQFALCIYMYNYKLPQNIVTIIMYTFNKHTIIFDKDIRNPLQVVKSTSIPTAATTN